MTDILIGADPELFVKDKAGKSYPAFGMIPGTKDAPFPVDKGATQVDGLALEFNIHPSKTEDEFVSNIMSVMGDLRKQVPGEYQFSVMPFAKFSNAIFDKLPKEAKILGCDPDFNAYTGKQNVIMGDPGNTPQRYAAGHIHIGWTNVDDPFEESHFDECCFAVKQLDACIGIFKQYWEPYNGRWNTYGQPGVFRPKKYGVEWRTPSNSWLRDEKLMRWMFKTAKKAMEDLIAGKLYFDPNVPAYRPTAVCPQPDAKIVAVMQKVSKELNVELLKEAA